jgi:hypothetical protein
MGALLTGHVYAHQYLLLHDTSHTDVLHLKKLIKAKEKYVHHSFCYNMYHFHTQFFTSVNYFYVTEHKSLKIWQKYVAFNDTKSYTQILPLQAS